MSKEAEQVINEEISKNETLCDLSLIEVNRNNLSFILDNLDTNKNIGYIKLSENSNDEINDLKEKIENKLIKNNEDYRLFPNDYIHCLLSLHCNQTKFESDYKINNSLFSESKFKLLQDQEWKVEEVFEEKGYKSVVYINQKKKNIVLAFQGIKLEIKDFFLKDNLIEPTVYSMIANLDIAPQTVLSYIHTQTAVDLCKKDLNYSLSFTGHGFGAWLAEQAIYFSMKEFSFNNFGFDNVKAVTFDSPGSYNYLEILNSSNIYNNETKFDLSDLNIVTYLSAPSIMNTCNKHIGKVYRIKTEITKKHSIDTDKIVFSLINSIQQKEIQERIKKCYKDKIENQSNKYTFILNGCISLFHDGLNIILNEFDPIAGKPLKYKKITDWPKFEFSPLDNFKNNFNDLFDFKNVIDSIPASALIPDKFKKIVSKGVNSISVKAVEYISKNYLNGLTVVINLVIEIKNGNLNIDQFQYNFNEDNWNKGEITVSDERDFNIKYLGHYKIEDINLKEDILLNKNEGSIDQFLFNLFYYVKDINDLKDLNDSFIEKQLFELTKLYQLDSNKNKTVIKSTLIEIELIRYRLERLLKINKDLKSFLHKLIGLKRSNDDLIYLGNADENSPDLYFIGRINELNKIEEIFKTNQFVYIHGRSGCGKTQLAIKYSKIAREKNYITRWIRNKEIYQSCIELAEELKINISNKTSFEELIKKIKINLNKFTIKNKKNIMFFIDNLVYESKDESLNEFQHLINGFESKNIKFLITTKDQSIISKLNKEHSYEKVPLDLFTLQDCLDFIDIKLDKDSIHKAFLKTEWEDLFKIISLKTDKILLLPIDLNKFLSKLNEEGQFWNKNEIEKYLENEIKTKYKLLKEQNKNAHRILCYLGFLNEDTISKYLIYKLLINNDIDQNDLINGIDYLIRNSEISINENGYYTIHETTQLGIINSLEEQQKYVYLNRIIETLDKLIDQENIKENNRKLNNKIKEYFDHSIKVLSLPEMDRIKSNSIASILDKIAYIFENILIKYDKAIEYYEKSLNIRKKSLPENHPDFVTSYNNLSSVYYNKGEYDKAIEYFNHSLDIRKISLPGNHPDLATSYNDLGAVHRYKGEYNKAIEYFIKSLNIRVESLRENHPDIATSYYNLGIAYYNKGEHEKAIEYFNNSLNIRKKSLPENHPDLARSYNSLGILYYNKGEHEKAIAYYNQSLDIRKKALPENHPDLATSYNNLGTVYDNKGESDKAIAYYNQSLDIRKKSLPENHPDLATSYYNLGLLYGNKGDSDNAIEYYEKSLNIRKKSLPKNHPDFVTSYNNLSSVYYNKGEYDKAIEYYNQSLNITKKYLPENHSDLATSYNKLGALYHNNKEYDKAIEYYNQSLNIRKKSLPENQPDLATSFYNLGLVYDNKEKYDKAIKYYNQSLDIRKKSLPENDPDLATSYYSLGLVYYNKGKYDKAIEYYNQSLNMRKKSLPENHPDLAKSYHYLWLVYDKKKEFDKANEYYNQSLNIRK
jgi:tetratricopeptide (TPR) repeat protein